uniref:ShKT domain-containing protein n=1 Tax=Pseudo-nitzschia australis TaxID=44445 RepID=A0A7S4EQX6_9STRA|mmetsp:Transcript_27510/g.60530  ORF Transcript_27510/g.60530 Transcript_27510/m.60530 type:complete len:357 (-) Transcript_27510:365-1435(-)|eukprot:CAMPEP_0168176574 /NCGR_PEP_ID=MMETSP0139_2-20121125/7874_1 /TAXON_ID=44445 /ORGANISM="Pseudo-nitzschia australis, Strain 10249 10 AB" /LENGTH=356 /DNA_ID=CAMNT_0008095329 /DNA_START=209 /DNA_END=1279 /DNA_ORIENTATION=-
MIKIHSKETTRLIMTVAVLIVSSLAFAVQGNDDNIDPTARAWEPSVQNPIATFDSVARSAPATEPVVVAANDIEEGDIGTTVGTNNEEDGIAEVQAELERLCTDDPNLQYQHMNRNEGQIDLKNCTWVATKPMVRCNFQFQESENLFLRDFCPRSCGLCPEAAQVFPCPEDTPTLAPSSSPTDATTVATSTGNSASSSADGTGSSSSDSTESNAGLVAGGGTVVNNRESSVGEGKNRMTLAISLSVALLLLLLLLLLLYYCCCRKIRVGKNNQESDTDDKENHDCPIHNTKSTESKGSRLIGFVVSTFNGRRNCPQVDVRRCNSGYCKSCEEEDDINRVKSVDTYENQQEYQNDQC